VTGVAPLTLPSRIPIVLPSQHAPISPAQSLQASKTVSSILAGGNYGSRDGIGEDAQLGYIRNLILDARGNIVHADSVLNVIRCVTMAGEVTTIAGTGKRGKADGNMGEATFDSPLSVALDGEGAMYVADTGNDRLRKVTAAGQVLTLTRTRGWYKDPDEGLQHDFSAPLEIAAARDGTLYLTDRSRQIFKVTPDGHVSVFFDGPGRLRDSTHVEPIFYKPRHLMLEPDGRLLVADEGNRCVWRIGDDRVAERLLGQTVYAQGFIDGDRSVSKNGVITGMAYGKDATLYYSDASNQCVRKLSPAGVVTTLLGDGKPGNILGIATEARLKSIEGVVVGLDGNLYLADSGNYRILKLSPI
jgi:DNA-binding beta-propeller fold protein YncE